MSTNFLDQKLPIIIVVRSIVEKHYPNVEAVILTGSQTEPDRVTKQSDIDIILFGEEFSGVTTQTLKDGGHKVDFTKVSISDLHRIMIDYSYDHRGTILHMIMTGIIIKDEHYELTSIQKKAKELYSSGNSAIENELRLLRNNLAKIKKNILKDLDHRYTFFLIMEFTHLISSAYILTNQGWFPSNSYRRTKALLSIDKNAEFMDSLISIVKESFQSTNEQKSKIINFIDRYLDNPFTSKTASGFHLRFIINLEYKTQSHTHFFTKVLRDVFNDPYLSKIYTYSQTHTSIHIFKHHFVLLFNNQHSEFNENKVLNALYQIFNKSNRPIKKLHITSGEYLIRQFIEPKIYIELEKLLSLASLNMHKAVSLEGKYDKSKSMLIAQIVLVQLAKSLGIHTSIFSKLMQYLYFKWRSSIELNTNVDYKKIKYINKRIQRKSETYYTSNVHILKGIHEAAWESPHEIELAFWDMDSLIQSCEEYSKIVFKSNVHIDNYILKILNKHVKEDTILKECYYFSIASELILNVLCVEKHHFSIVAYNLSRSTPTEQNFQILHAN